MVQSKKGASAGYWNYAENFTYNATGAVASMQLGNGKWESTQFNSRLQPTQIALGATPNATNLLKLDYSYGTTANNGNVLSHTITVPTVGVDTGFTAVQTYNYDSLNRLKDATEMLTPHGGSQTLSWRQTFTFDRYGNRRFDTANTTTIPAGCLEPVCNSQIDPATNKLIGYQFDNAGNTKTDANGQIFIYDGENKQTEVRTASNVVVGQYFYNGDGRRFRTFNVIDDHRREVLAIEIDLNLGSRRVLRVLDRVAESRGLPQRIRFDNGPGFTSIAFADRAERNGVELEFIKPGRPMQNGFIERFNRTYRQAILDMYIFERQAPGARTDVPMDRFLQPSPSARFARRHASERTKRTSSHKAEYSSLDW